VTTTSDLGQVEWKWKGANGQDNTYTGRLLQFVVMREMPDNQRPEYSYDVLYAVVRQDDGTFITIHPDNLRHRSG